MVAQILIDIPSSVREAEEVFSCNMQLVAEVLGHANLSFLNAIQQRGVAAWLEANRIMEEEYRN